MLAKPLVSFAVLAMFALATPARAAETTSTSHAQSHSARALAHAHASSSDAARGHGAHKAKVEAANTKASKPKADAHAPAAATATAKAEPKVESKPAPVAAKAPDAASCAAPSSAETTLDEIRAALAGKRSDRTTLPDLPASVSVPLESDSDDAHGTKSIESDPHGKVDAKANEKAEKKSEPAHKHGSKVEAPRAPAKAQPTDAEPGQKRKRDMKSPARRGHPAVSKPGASGASV